MNTFKTSKKFIKEKVAEFKQYYHIVFFIPQKDYPFELTHIKFYPEHFIYKNRGFNYGEINGIVKKNSVQYVNGIETENSFSFKLQVGSEQFTDNIGTIDLSISTWFLSLNKKRKKSIILLCDWIERKTFLSRLNKTFEEIIMNGYFLYSKNLKIYNNGDLHVNDEYKVNLNEAIRDNTLTYGIKYKNSIGAELGENPYILKINYPERKSQFLSNATSIEIDTTFNGDVFNKVLNELLKNNYILKL